MHVVSMKERQSPQGMRGEITARSKYVEQQVRAHSEIVERARARPKIKKSHSQFTILRNQRIALSPFLEIGSERCERSMLLVTDFKANGFAADLSYHSLDFAAMYSKVLGMKLPYRVCCDVHNLPFKNKSFSFVFCYATLHHFLNHTPVIKEVVRVLDSGSFFFDEEPVKHYLKLPINITCTPKRGWMAYAISHFLRRTYPTTEFGIIENEDISINDWNEILSSFDEREVVLYVPGLRSKFRSINPASVFERILVCKLDSHRFSLKKAIASFIGATISGLCFRKNSENSHAPVSTRNIFDLLACPNCLEINRAFCDARSCETECKVVCSKDAIKIEGGKAKIAREDCNLCFDCLHNCPLNAIEKPKLFRKEKGFVCRNCGKSFPIINDILMLFSEEQGKYLYPKLLGARALKKSNE